MSKTVHVYPSGKGWAVQRGGHRAIGVFATQKEAIEKARSIARAAAPSQIVVHGRDGRLRGHETYGLPKVLRLPGKRSPTAIKIEKAVSRMALARLMSDPHSPRA